MKCINHERCGQRNVENTVLLLCDCLVCLCEDCARSEVLICLSLERKRRKIIPDKQDSDAPTYEALYCCPQCHFKVSSKLFDVLSGVDEALEAEENLLRASMTSVSKSYDKHTTSVIDLQDCWTRMMQESETETALPMPYDENEAMKVAKLRRGIVALALEQFDGYVNPYDCITFTKNRFYRNSLSSADVYECIMCQDSVQPGYSVQLTCTCNYVMCRTCVLINAHNRPDTYINGVHCSWCAVPSRSVFSNVDTVMACENALLHSATHYLSSKLVAHRGDTDRSHYLNMIRMYWCMGYKGNINVLDEKELSLGTITVPRLRLEVAKLEELRLNMCGIVDTYSIHYNAEHGIVHESVGTSGGIGIDDTPAGRFSIGFLHALQVKRNPFFEHFYTNNSGTTTNQTYEQHEWHAQCNKILSTLQVTSKLHTDKTFLDLFDKIVLHCLHHGPCYSPNSTSTSSVDGATYTTQQITQLLENFVYHKLTSAPPPNHHDQSLPQAKPLDEFMLSIVKKVNIVKSVQGSLQKLVQLGYVTASGDGKDTTYTLEGAQYTTVHMEPTLRDSAAGRVGSAKTRPVVPRTTLSTVSASTSATVEATAAAGLVVTAAHPRVATPSVSTHGALPLGTTPVPAVPVHSAPAPASVPTTAVHVPLIVPPPLVAPPPIVPVSAITHAVESYECDYFSDRLMASEPDPSLAPAVEVSSADSTIKVSRVVLRLFGCMSDCLPERVPARGAHLRKRKHCIPYPVCNVQDADSEDLSDSDAHIAHNRRVYSQAWEEVEKCTKASRKKCAKELAAIREQGEQARFSGLEPEIQAAIQTLRAQLAARSRKELMFVKSHRKLERRLAAVQADNKRDLLVQQSERELLAQQVAVLQAELEVHTRLLARSEEALADSVHAVVEGCGETGLATPEHHKLNTEIKGTTYQRQRLVRNDAAMTQRLADAEKVLHNEKHRMRQVEDNRDVCLEHKRKLQQELDALRDLNAAELAELDRKIQHLRTSVAADAKRSSNTTNPHMMDNLAASLVHLESEQNRLVEVNVGLNKTIAEHHARKHKISQYIRNARQLILFQQDQAVSIIDTEKKELLEEQRELQEAAKRWEEQQKAKHEQSNTDMQILLSSFQS